MENRLSTVLPRDVHAVGGFLGQRFHNNRVNRLKDQVFMNYTKEL